MDLHEALGVMNGHATLPDGSDPWLLADVQARASHEAVAHRVPVKPKMVTAAAGLVGPLPVRPIEAMLHLVRATRPHVRTEVYDYYRYWAVLRYLGVLSLEGPSGELVLSSAGRRVNGNQRRVMSEELGVGFGTLLAERWCRAMGYAGAIGIADVDVVIREGFGWVTPARVTTHGRQPDYLLLLGDPGRPTSKRVKTLECKGTTAPSYAVSQLGSGVTQLACLAIDGSSPQGLAAAIVSGRNGLAYLAVDPDDEDEPVFEVTTEKVDALRRAKQLSRLGPMIAVDGDELATTAVATSVGALADFAGDLAAASQWLPPSTLERLSRTERPRLTQGTDGGDFVGVETVLPAPDGRGRLRVFEGVARQVDEAMGDGRIESILEAQEAFATGRAGAPPEQDPAGDSDQATAISSDGAILRLSID
jgi:hypothetical protein